MDTIPRNRDELLQHLHQRMLVGFGRYKDEKKLEYDTGLLKTLIVETDYKNNAENTIEDTLRSEFDSDIDFLESKDRKFRPIRLPSVDSSEVFYLDMQDSRFWAIHTFTRSKNIHKFTDIIARSALFDTAWLPMKFLTDTTEHGQFKGFTGKFDDNFFEDDEEKASKISLKLWGGLAPIVVKTFQSNPELANKLSISGVRIKTSIEKDTGAFVIEDINYMGKTTAIGESAISHFDFIDHVLIARYKMAIEEKIEKAHSIRLRDNVLMGKPLFVKFNKPGFDVQEFSKSIFTAKKPFRLWGVPEIVDEHFARVYVVDMHVGESLTFEILPTTIRIFINEGVCGNTVARFFTLFQQHFDSQARLVDGDDNDIF